LIDRGYETDQASNEKEQWKRFDTHIRHLNNQTKDNESIKVLWLGRHGQGWHNVAEAKYGTKAWDVRLPVHPSQYILTHMNSVTGPPSTAQTASPGPTQTLHQQANNKPKT